MAKDIRFDYEEGCAMCIIKYKNKDFKGFAFCHPDDADMESERTGCCIAEARAYIQVQCFKRTYEIKPQLDILYHLYHNMSRGKNFNPKSYEAKMVRSQIKALEKDLAAVNQIIADERKYLKEYIDQKEKLYQKLRLRDKNKQ